MHILISGEDSTKIADHLRTFWSNRGVAAYLYDYLSTAGHAYDIVARVLGKDLGLSQEGARDKDFLETLLSWGRKKDLALWGKVARDRIAPVTDRWDSLKLPYFVIIPGIVFKEDFDVFPCAYRVHAGLEVSKNLRGARIDFMTKHGASPDVAAAQIAEDIAVKMRAPFINRSEGADGQ